MADTMTPDEIKQTRGVYGLSQKSFAALLGIGEASMVRYEQGSQPSKANANLIRAARIPEFMLDCINRSGDAIPQSQRNRAEEYIYAVVPLNKAVQTGNGAKEMNETYSLVLQQEVLNEQAANLISRLTALLQRSPDRLMQTMVDRLWAMKPDIVDSQNRSAEKLDAMRGYLRCVQECVDRYSLEAVS